MPNYFLIGQDGAEVFELKTNPDGSLYLGSRTDHASSGKAYEILSSHSLPEGEVFQIKASEPIAVFKTTGDIRSTGTLRVTPHTTCSQCLDVVISTKDEIDLLKSTNAMNLEAIIVKGRISKAQLSNLKVFEFGGYNFQITDSSGPNALIYSKDTVLQLEISP